MKTKAKVPKPDSRQVTPTASATERREQRAKLAGALKHLHYETQIINQIIEEEFEQIDPEDWE